MKYAAVLQFTSKHLRVTWRKDLGESEDLVQVMAGGMMSYVLDEDTRTSQLLLSSVVHMFRPATRLAFITTDAWGSYINLPMTYLRSLCERGHVGFVPEPPDPAFVIRIFSSCKVSMSNEDLLHFSINKSISHFPQAGSEQSRNAIWVSPSNGTLPHPTWRLPEFIQNSGGADGAFKTARCLTGTY